MPAAPAFRLAHVSDFHYDGSAPRLAALHAELDRVVALDPDAVVVSGDLTSTGSDEQMGQVHEALSTLGDVPVITVPGNRDVVLDEHLVAADDEDGAGLSPGVERAIREQENAFARTGEAGLPLGPDTPGTAVHSYARTYGALNVVHESAGATIVGLDSNTRVRRPVLEAARVAFRRAAPGALKALVTHHPYVPIATRPVEVDDFAPNAGRLLQLALDEGVHVICTGHYHRSVVSSYATEGAEVQLSMAPTLYLASKKKDRGLHLVDLDERGDVKVRQVRTELEHMPLPVPEGALGIQGEDADADDIDRPRRVNTTPPGYVPRPRDGDRGR